MLKLSIDGSREHLTFLIDSNNTIKFNMLPDHLWENSRASAAQNHDGINKDYEACAGIFTWLMSFFLHLVAVSSHPVHEYGVQSFWTFLASFFRWLFFNLLLINLIRRWRWFIGIGWVVRAPWCFPLNHFHNFFIYSLLKK